MNSNILRSALAAATMSAVTVLSTQAPARADGTGTTYTIIGAAAAIAGIATAINVSNKNRVANTVQGYLPDGSTVYEDGHVVTRNGYSYYPGNQGQQVSCSNQQCAIYGNGYNAYNRNGYNGGYNNNGYYDNARRYDNNGRWNNGRSNNWNDDNNNRRPDDDNGHPH